MNTYSVKQIADMLGTKPETVRRWIRSGKLKAKQPSKKDGNIITEGDLNKFLKSSPKYAGLIAGIAISSMISPIATASLIENMIVVNKIKKEKEIKKENENPSFSKNDIIKYLKEEIVRRNISMKQKLKTIEQLLQEIEHDKQQISEYKSVLSRLEEKES